MIDGPIGESGDGVVGGNCDADVDVAAFSCTKGVGVEIFVELEVITALEEDGKLV